MTGPDPAVAATRLAVRRGLPVLTADDGTRWVPDLGPARTVLVACSGGADSLALLAATVFEARHVTSGLRVVGAVVDHGLQDGSAEHTARVVAQMAGMGADETASVRVTVDPGPRGVEAGAREARYAALGQLAAHLGANHVLLGHTLDDQAETVLLGLTQGSGPRSLQGMRRELRDHGVLFRRPLLEVTRAQTEAACRAEGIEWWEDPQNRDQRFLRARVRHVVMPLLEAELGPGVAAALARTGPMVRDDLAALDAIGEAEHARLDLAAGVEVWDLEQLPSVVLARVLRLAALAAGSPARDLTHGHVRALQEMVWASPGSRELHLPGHVRAERRGDVVRVVGPTGGQTGGPAGAEGPDDPGGPDGPGPRVAG